MQSVKQSSGVAFCLFARCQPRDSCPYRKLHSRAQRGVELLRRIRLNRICLELLSLNLFADTPGERYAKDVSDCGFLGGDSFVTMVQATDLRNRDDWPRRDGLDRSADWSVLADR
jgi:hypothetical protein